MSAGQRVPWAAMGDGRVVASIPNGIYYHGDFKAVHDRDEGWIKRFLNDPTIRSCARFRAISDGAVQLPNSRPRSSLTRCVTAIQVCGSVPGPDCSGPPRLNRELRLPRHGRSGNRHDYERPEPLPAGYLEFIEVKDAGGRVLAAADPSFADEQFASASAGLPSILLSWVRYQTWPASSSNLMLRYYEAIPDLATASTNWFLTKCPASISMARSLRPQRS